MLNTASSTLICIASLSIGYGGESSGGSYHSIYDSFDHYTRFIDPTFGYGIAQAKTTGRLMLRLANADVLPMEFTTFAETMNRYVDELMKLAERMRTETEERNTMIRDHTFDMAADPMKPALSPKIEEPVPYVNLAPLQNAVAHLERSARDYDTGGLPPETVARQAALDHALMHVEQALLAQQGLPRRPWFRHQIYAPGFYTGYGVKTVPGVREAIEQKEWKQIAQQVDIVAQTIDAYAIEVDRAAAIVKGQ